MVTKESNIMGEIIYYTPHDGPEFAEDNAKLLQIITDTVNKTIYTSSIKSFIRKRNCRAAYLALLQHNIGNFHY